LHVKCFGWQVVWSASEPRFVFLFAWIVAKSAMQKTKKKKRTPQVVPFEHFVVLLTGIRPHFTCTWNDWKDFRYRWFYPFASSTWTCWPVSTSSWKQYVFMSDSAFMLDGWAKELRCRWFYPFASSIWTCWPVSTSSWKQYVSCQLLRLCWMIEQKS